MYDLRTMRALNDRYVRRHEARKRADKERKHRIRIWQAEFELNRLGDELERAKSRLASLNGKNSRAKEKTKTKAENRLDALRKKHVAAQQKLDEVVNGKDEEVPASTVRGSSQAA